MCYCEIGAGGEPCISREHCDARRAWADRIAELEAALAKSCDEGRHEMICCPADSEAARYRKALEDAPIPNFAGFHDGTYADWYTGERKEALKGNE